MTDSKQWFEPTVSGAAVSAQFGQRPRNPSTTWRHYGVHSGVDLSIASGSPVYAIGDAKVVKTGFDKGVGNYITFETAPGQQYTQEHLDSVGVKVGDVLKGGSLVGKSGNTGSLSQGAHLHTEFLRDGKVVSPDTWFGGKAPSWAQSAKGAPSELGKGINYGGTGLSGSEQFSNVKAAPAMSYTTAGPTTSNVFGKVY